MSILYILLAALAVMLASLAGVCTISSRRLGALIERNLSMLVSFSAGVFLLIGWELTSEALEHAPSVYEGVGWILAGSVALSLVFRLVPTFHHHHDEQEDAHQHSPIDGRRVLLSDALHNVGDGILLAAAFAVSAPFGVITAGSVFIHELVQEVSEFFVLRQAGYETKRALSLNFLVSGTILLGAIGGFFLLETFEALEAPLLGLTAGALAVVLTHDLIPHTLRSSQGFAHAMRHLLWFLIGALLMWSVQSLAAHAHEAEEHRDEAAHASEEYNHGPEDALHRE